MIHKYSLISITNLQINRRTSGTKGNKKIFIESLQGNIPKILRAFIVCFGVNLNCIKASLSWCLLPGVFLGSFDKLSPGIEISPLIKRRIPSVDSSGLFRHVKAGIGG